MGRGRFIETCLKATRSDGVRDVVLKYVSHEIEGDRLEVVSKDVNDGLAVTLRYRVYPQGIIERSALIRNGTPQTVTLESAQSAAWHLPPGEGYRLSYLTGRWAGETQLVREDVHAGLKVIESRRGNTGQVNPWFAIDGAERAGEDHGAVWFGAIGWSGNWRITVEQTPHQRVRVVGGFNSFDFSFPLAPGDALETPPFYAGYTAKGFGEASRIFHRFQREQILPAASRASNGQFSTTHGRRRSSRGCERAVRACTQGGATWRRTVCHGRRLVRGEESRSGRARGLDGESAEVP